MNNDAGYQDTLCALIDEITIERDNWKERALRAEDALVELARLAGGSSDLATIRKVLSDAEHR